MERNAVAVFFVLSQIQEKIEFQPSMSSKEGWEFLIRLQLVEISEIAKVASKIAYRFNNSLLKSISVPIIDEEGHNLYKDIVVSFDHHTKTEVLNLVSSYN